MIMALSRLGRSYNALENLSRISYSGNLLFRKSQSPQYTALGRDFSNSKGITNIRYNGQNNDLCLSYRLKNLKLDQWHIAPSTQFHTNIAERKNATPPEIKEAPPTEKPLTKRQALKQAVARYGPIILIFHISHSLVTLGIFYLLVKSGVDMLPVAKWLSDSGKFEQLQVVLCTSSTFVVAYSIYKLTAPIRIGLTLVGFPYVMKVLRYFGYQRRPPPRPTKPEH